MSHRIKCNFSVPNILWVTVFEALDHYLELLVVYFLCWWEVLFWSQFLVSAASIVHNCYLTIFHKSAEHTPRKVTQPQNCTSRDEHRTTSQERSVNWFIHQPLSLWSPRSGGCAGMDGWSLLPSHRTPTVSARAAAQMNCESPINPQAACEASFSRGSRQGDTTSCIWGRRSFHSNANICKTGFTWSFQSKAHTGQQHQKTSSRFR